MVEPQPVVFTPFVVDQNAVGRLLEFVPSFTTLSPAGRQVVQTLIADLAVPVDFAYVAFGNLDFNRIGSTEAVRGQWLAATQLIADRAGELAASPETPVSGLSGDSSVETTLGRVVLQEPLIHGIANPHHTGWVNTQIHFQQDLAGLPAEAVQLRACARELGGIFGNALAIYSENSIGVPLLR